MSLFLEGNTANSEFEFLTGDSLAFLPAGSVAYQQFVKDETPTLVEQLKLQGYQTAAIHPYYRSDGTVMKSMNISDLTIRILSRILIILK